MSERSELLDRDLLATWPMPVDEHGDKHVRGSVLVIGGSSTTPGAALLAGVGALRMGAGRLQIATAASVATALAVALPEALVAPLDEGPDGGLSLASASCDVHGLVAAADAVLVGPGMVVGDATDALTRSVLAAARDDAIVVLDAAAMVGACAPGGSLTPDCARRTIVTPNRQESALVLDRDEADEDDGGTVADIAVRIGVTVTSFGHVAAPDGRRWATRPPTPGLGTSGSGDVLAGLAAGAGARCGDGPHAACWATYAHAAAGHRAGARRSQLGFLARELLDEVPAVLREIEQMRRGPG